ncbi:MAG: hypothetical protein DHS80DRAFT_30084 [Piptocephalis tieghemiana]|nr:MAG: hypothetical protein DHS80DRAFT_30084 [Piptocephalis tieghemiana]
MSTTSHSSSRLDKNQHELLAKILEMSCVRLRSFLKSAEGLHALSFKHLCEMAKFLESVGLRQGPFPYDKESLVEHLCPFFGLIYAPKGWAAAPTTRMAHPTLGNTTTNKAVFVPQSRYNCFPQHILAKIPRLPLCIREEQPVVTVNLFTTTRNPKELIGTQAKMSMCIPMIIPRSSFVNALRRGIVGMGTDDLCQRGNIRAILYIYNRQPNAITSLPAAMRNSLFSIQIDKCLQDPPSTGKEKGLDITMALGMDELKTLAQSTMTHEDPGTTLIELCMAKGTLVTGLAGIWLVRDMSPEEAVGHLFLQRLRPHYHEALSKLSSTKQTPKKDLPAPKDLNTLSTESMVDLYFSLDAKLHLFHDRPSPPRSQGRRKRSVGEDEVKEDAVIVSFICPITLKRIKYPGRGDECRHPQCFDIEAIFEHHREGGEFPCPICQLSYPFMSIIPDTRFYECLLKYPQDDRCLMLEKGGDFPLTVPQYASEVMDVEKPKGVYSLPELIQLEDRSEDKSDPDEGDDVVCMPGPDPCHSTTAPNKDSSYISQPSSKSLTTAGSSREDAIIL